MIRSVAVVPSAPLLLPEYTGRTDAGAALRSRAVAVVRSAVRQREASAPPPGGVVDRVAERVADRVVLVVATDREPRSTRPPLGRRVGTHLLELAGLEPGEVVVVPWDATVEECRGAGEPLGDSPDSVSLVVVADGSARRGEKAPGHFDERALALDAELVAALEASDAGRLLGLDADMCSQLLVHGRAPLQVAAAAMGRSGRLRCTGIDVEDPFGVLYVTALLEAVPAAGA